MPVTLSFAPFSASVSAPVPSDDTTGGLITFDYSKFGRPEQLHVAFAGVEAFRAAHGTHLPGLHVQVRGHPGGAA